MRSGSITKTGGSCGNPNCHCHRAGEAAHGPYHRLTRKGTARRSPRRFPLRQVWPKRSARWPSASASGNRASSSMNRTDLLAAAGDRGQAVGSGEKTAEVFPREVVREIHQRLWVVFRGRGKTGCLDLEAVETAVRAAMHRAGAAVLSQARMRVHPSHLRQGGPPHPRSGFDSPAPEPSGRRKNLAIESTSKQAGAALSTRQKESSSPIAPNGSGIQPACTSRA